MQLAHRRRRSAFRGPTDERRSAFRGPADERSRGAVLVEAAFVTPVFFMLVFGLVEIGLAMNDNLAVAHTVRAASRVASASGNDLLADYGIIQAIKRESASLDDSKIKMIVVYRADQFGEAPSPTCQAGSPSASTGAGERPCNVYYPADFKKVKSRWGCKPVEKLEVWCPTTRKVTQTGTGPEYVGVWMKVEHTWLTRMFGTTLMLTDQSVIRLEPRLRA